MAIEVQPQPTLNEAADALIQAIEDTNDAPGIRAGIAPLIALGVATVDADNPANRDAVDLLVFWLALDQLLAAVIARKADQ